MIPPFKNEKKVAWFSEEPPLEITGFLIEKPSDLESLEKEKASFIALAADPLFIKNYEEALKKIDLPLIVLFSEKTSVKELFQVQEDFRRSVSFERPLKPKVLQKYLEALIKDPLLSNQAHISENLFERYKKSIPEKLLIIEEGLKKLENDFDQTVAKELQSEFHKGAGCSGSFGYMKAGKILSQMERKWVIFLQSGEQNEKEREKILKFLRNKFHELKGAYQYQN
ncbi:Hpt domain-containing protein [Criblamydia sequanensis]|uniref:Uncharacterized protein n=1 Tax=Candidatus Criblamydia sequanensis CRIB-18 TaxID=1437425 RepID=A0A090CXX0_9BACT|nr:Hpt domain-containing protein [Criblamydia sequanensis]CDR33097.1 hypothetical protein CSEC_0258 [Criblamydia sequanensis CRIB-18]